MIDERYQVQARSIDNGEVVRGYLTKQRHSPKDPNYLPPYELEFVIDHEEKGVMLTSFIDPATIEPVKVKPINDLVFPACPNCESVNIDIGNMKHKFCPDCGQALDWTE